jgi:DNA-directed RNA polymerase specialized sigma24 family protein
MSGKRSLGDTVSARSPVAKQSAPSMERELLANIFAGSRSAMAELYFLYFARLGNFFLHVTGNRDLVQELISDTLFDVWRASEEIESDTSVPAWIMGLAYSHGHMHRLATPESASPHVLLSAPHTEPDSVPATASQNSRSLEDSLLKLPFAERAALHLVYAGCYSRQSMADIMNMSCESVDVLLAQARRRLRYLADQNERQQQRSQAT